VSRSPLPGGYIQNTHAAQSQADRLNGGIFGQRNELQVPRLPATNSHTHRLKQEGSPLFATCPGGNDFNNTDATYASLKQHAFRLQPNTGRMKHLSKEAAKSRK